MAVAGVFLPSVVRARVLSRACSFARFVTPALLASALTTGCSAPTSMAIPTGAVRLPPRSGGVAIFASSKPVGTELGIVEVKGFGHESSVDELLPIFVRRVADLGGNAAVIEGVRARFNLVQRPYFETFYYA
ncbi:hypothetical protein EON77_21110, partial [bacterium]